jgi:aquaporin Z
MIRRLMAETIGTALLVFFGCGTAALMFGLRLAGIYSVGVVATAFAFGLVLVGIAYAFGAVSGAHVNPAVTLGAYAAGRMQLVEAAWYWLAQFVGGIIGILVLWAMLSGSPFFSTSRPGSLGQNGYGSLSAIHMDWAGAFLVEIVMTAIFVYVILAVTAKAAHPLIAGLTIGLTLTFVHLLGISIDGTSVNPARSLAPALVVGGTALHQVWLFICAPIVGALVAAVVYRTMHPDEDLAHDDPDPDVPLDADVAAASSTAPTSGAAISPTA